MEEVQLCGKMWEGKAGQVATGGGGGWARRQEQEGVSPLWENAIQNLGLNLRLLQQSPEV